MKKTLLLGTALLVSAVAFAGNNEKAKAVAIADKGDVVLSATHPSMKKPSESILVGDMANAYSTQAAGTNQIAYDPVSGTLAVAKRRGPSDTHVPAGSGQIAYHVSDDAGATWSIAQHANSFAPQAAGRHPNVAVWNNGTDVKIVTQWAELIGGGFGGLGVSVSSPDEDGLPTIDASLFEETLIIGDDTLGYAVPDEITVEDDGVTMWFVTQDLVTYNNYFFKSSNGVDWTIEHIVADVDNGGILTNANPSHGDFYGNTGWWVTGIEPDSTYAADNDLSQGTDAYYPYLVKFVNGEVVDEGVLDVYALPGIAALNIDTWQFNYDIVTDRNGDFHLFMQLYDGSGDEVASHGVFEVYSTDGGVADAIESAKVADLSIVSWTWAALNTRAEVDAARDPEGKYVFVKWMDMDNLDPDTTSELYMTGRPISGDYADVISLNDNDFTMQYFSQMANRVAPVEDTESTFQAHVLWTEYGLDGTGTPSDVAAANLYYVGPQLELDAWEGTENPTLTFMVNTAFVQDTVSGTNGSTVSLRGGGIFGDWSFDQGLKLTNVGGDYWKGTIEAPVGPTGTFKIVTATNSGTGWDRVENNIDVTGDETVWIYTSGLKATYTDPVTGEEITRNTAWNPLAIAKDGSDSVAVHFRVNMQSLETFPRATAEVYVRGSMIDDSWSVTSRGRMYPEVRHDDMCCGAGLYEADLHFYSRTVLVDPAKKGTNSEYKFTFNAGGSTTWEDGIQNIGDGGVAGNGNRVFTVNNDTTLFWKWWLNIPYTVKPGDTEFNIDISADMFKAINTNGFDPATDVLVVRAGFAGTATEVLEDTLDAPLFGTVYTGRIDGLEGFADKYIAYQYYKINAQGDFEEFYFDVFDETGTTTGPKFRKVTTPATSADLVAEDILDDNVSTHRMPFFKNTNAVGVATTLTIEADLNPAVSFVTLGGGSLSDIQGGSLVIDASNIGTLDLYVNGPATGGWGGWNAIALGETRKMSDDGSTKGDETADDNIWTIQFPYEASAIVSQEYKFGIGGGDNEAGFGNNHMANLLPTAENSVEVQFGEIQPSRYVVDGVGYWDFVTEEWVVTGVADDYANVKEFNLLQNYPNPFNPSTMIPFTVAKAGVVNFEVYNVLGQVVSSFKYNANAAGFHQVNFAANNLSTGSYLVKMTAGDFSKTIKMVFAK